MTHYCNTNNYIKSRDYFDRIAHQWDTLSDINNINCLTEVIAALHIKKDSFILDIGSGTGVLIPIILPIISKKGKLIAIDSSRKMLHMAMNKYGNSIEFLQADVHDIPLDNNLSDFAICYSCFPHFSNKQAALTEIARVLKPGGTLVIIHTASMININAMHQHIGGAVKDHLIPQEMEVRQMLRNSGFDKIDIVDSSNKYLVNAIKVEETG